MEPKLKAFRDNTINSHGKRFVGHREMSSDWICKIRKAYRRKPRACPFSNMGILSLSPVPILLSNSSERIAVKCDTDKYEDLDNNILP